MSDFNDKPSGSDEPSDNDPTAVELMLRFKLSARILFRFVLPVIFPMLIGSAWWVGVQNLSPRLINRPQQGRS
jgi:hypothetical protein